jgi:hypothetical protein
MIDWWGVFHNLLWILGLALALAVLSLASYQAGVEKVQLRRKLGEPGFQMSFDAALILFCLGLLFGGRAWWEKVLWGGLAALWFGQALWLWRHPATRAAREKGEEGS